MINAHEAAKWFIFKNPELASGYIDENTKVNKLLYFSNLMYYCVHNENMISDDFVAFPNGPVVFSVYADYRYNGLNRLPQVLPDIELNYAKFLDIVNFIYGSHSTDELIEESHSHSLWKNVQYLIPNNPKIAFESVDESLRDYNLSLFQTYINMDFSRIKKEKISNNIYFYYKDSFEMTDEMINRLARFSKFDEPKFLEIIEGELVIS